MNLKIIICVALASISSHATAADKGDKHDIDLIQEVSSIQIEVDRAMATIQSKAALEAHLRNSKNSPLNALKKPLRDSFIRSLVFTRYGLASYSWKELSNISVQDAYKVLSLFGEQGAITSIPGISARNRNEENILLISPARSSPKRYMRAHTIENEACIVNSDSSPSSRCVYEYGSNCNPKCV